MILKLRFLIVILMFNISGISAEPLVKPKVDEDGTIHALEYVLPESSLISVETRAALKTYREKIVPEFRASPCPSLSEAKLQNVPEIRACHAKYFYKGSLYKNMTSRYDVDVQSTDIGGVKVEVFTPSGGISPKNKDRVLINLHGGGFWGGARTNSHLESMPIASMGEYKIVSVDYRMAPEFRFPSASQDVAAVYKVLLKDYRAENIGIYGCSAGGLLTAQVVSWLMKEGLPLPGGVGMFCAAAYYWNEGDSGHMNGYPVTRVF